MSLIFAASLLVAASIQGPAATAATSKSSNPITITDAWVRASEYSAKVGGMTGVFAKITNSSSRTIALVGGSSEVSDTVQVHQVVAGVMSEKPNGIKIPAHGSVLLNPGGLHVMLLNLKRPILPGATVVVTLKFSGASATKLRLLAKPVAAGGETYTMSPMPSAK